MADKRAFKMHPRLLWDVITKQAGTLQKAILEGTMNTVDAGATRCDITLTRDGFGITDDGKGFVGREEIENFFETFGYPHEEGDAHYGRFRMGRGQMFAFGANTWRSNEFKMVVDLKPHDKTSARDELNYDLFTLPDSVKGCSIAVDLYRKLAPSEVDDIEREIEKYVAWSPIPVTVNGRLVSKDPTKAKWDAETDDAWIRYRESGDLSIYNLGVLVYNEHSHRFGTGGIVVSKKKLDVNFARNSIIDTCPVWKRVTKRIREDAGTAISKKSNRINESERQSSLTDFLSGRVSATEILKLPLFELANGNRISLETLGERLKDMNGGRIGVAPLKDRVASRALESKLALVFSKGTLDIVNCETAIEFLGKVHRALTRSPSRDIHPFRFDPARKREIGIAEMRAIIPDDMKEIPKSKLKPGEKLALQVLEAANQKVQDLFLAAAPTKTARHPWQIDRLERHELGGSMLERMQARVSPDAGHREIRIGESNVAQAWTDGSKVIWFDRGMLRHIADTKGMGRLAMILVHEWLHDAPDTDTHVHDAAFYEMFHDLCVNTPIVGRAVDAMLERHTKVVRNEQRKPTGGLRTAEDRAAMLKDNPLDIPAAPKAPQGFPDGLPDMEAPELEDAAPRM